MSQTKKGTAEWAQHLDGVGISNGLVWSRDSKTFYYIDTLNYHGIDAFDYNVKTGKISNRRPAGRVDPAKDGHCDGCAIDDEDKIWVAMWNGGCVARYDPASGKQLMRIALPGVRQVSSCAFGGPNLQTLYVTTASCGVAQKELDKRQPNAGATFAIDLSAHGVRGVPAPRFRLPARLPEPPRKGGASKKRARE